MQERRAERGGVDAAGCGQIKGAVVVAAPPCHIWIRIDEVLLPGNAAVRVRAGALVLRRRGWAGPATRDRSWLDATRARARWVDV